MKETDQVLAVLDKLAHGLIVLADQLAELRAQAKFIEERLGRLQHYIQQTRVALTGDVDTMPFQSKES
jgi:hypothetical protein